MTLKSLSKSSPTSEMQVTSIRFEKALIDELKALSGTNGYQSLVRDILWNYVQQQSSHAPFQIRREDIRTIMAAEAYRQERCALSDRIIEPREEMWMALTADGQLVPISVDSLEDGSM
jgi:metal-responsive CopG/Arc/MetJ family transcriptional regulator